MRRALVEVREALTLADLFRLPAETGHSAMLAQLRGARRQIEECGPFRLLFSVRGEDDAVWCVWREDEGETRVLLAWAPGRHEPAFQAGRNLLTADKAVILLGSK